MNDLKYLIGICIVSALMLWAGGVCAVECTPYADCRYQGAPVRDATGEIKRDYKVISAYKKLHPCPSTGLHTGACPGWSLNHNCPLACGCVDAVWNLSWMRVDVKKIVDSYERKITASTPPQPDTAACINQIVR
jgi:hypothetical protein